jgi:hypothetical protein
MLLQECKDLAEMRYMLLMVPGGGEDITEIHKAKMQP